MTDVSVVIPVAPYHEAVAVEAAASCFAQTIRPTVIVVRDHNRRGAAWARNEGLRRVQTSYVVFLDADDVIDPAFIETCLRSISSSRYVYTDWKEDKADSTILKSAPTNAWTQGSYHVVTTLLYTSDVLKVGGFDTSLPAAEDTDFYMKLVFAGVCGIHLPQPLFHYRRGGQRANAFVNSPAYAPTMALINKRYGGKPMGCCGPNVPVDMVPANDQQPGDVLVMATWGGNHIERGRITGRMYPRTGNSKTLYVHPADQQARPDLFRLVEETPSPMPAQAPAADEDVIVFDENTVVGADGIAAALHPQPKAGAVMTADELAATLPAKVQPDAAKVVQLSAKQKKAEEKRQAAEAKKAAEAESKSEASVHPPAAE
jgi:hypothetical protein